MHLWSHLRVTHRPALDYDLAPPRPHPTSPSFLIPLSVLPPPHNTGKTVLARAAAADAGATLFLLNGPDVMSEYYGVPGVWGIDGGGGLPW